MPAGCPSPRRQRARRLRADRRCALRQRHGRHRRQRGAAHPGCLHRHRRRRLGHRRQHLAGRAARGGATGAVPAWSGLPGGSAGSTVDTDSNLADFIVRAVPDPQNTGSPPVPDPTQPSPTPTPPPTATPTATRGTDRATPAPTPTGTPSPAPIAIADARAQADGTTVTVEGDALTASDFTEGGGYLADATGGIAVLLDGGSFARGDHLIVTGTVDDRFAQRTIRAAGGDLVDHGIRRRSGSRDVADRVRGRVARGPARSNRGHHRRKPDSAQRRPRIRRRRRERRRPRRRRYRHRDRRCRLDERCRPCA